MILGLPHDCGHDDGLSPDGAELLLLAAGRGDGDGVGDRGFGPGRGGGGQGSGQAADEVVVVLPVDQTVRKKVQNVGKKVFEKNRLFVVGISYFFTN